MPKRRVLLWARFRSFGNVIIDMKKTLSPPGNPDRTYRVSRLLVAILAVALTFFTSTPAVAGPDAPTIVLGDAAHYQGNQSQGVNYGVNVLLPQTVVVSNLTSGINGVFIPGINVSGSDDF